MDPITQGALGAACAQSVLYPKDKRNAWVVGAISGMAADLDLVIRSNTDPLLSIIYHRQFTHSLIFIPIGALLVALALYPFKRFRMSWGLTFYAALIGYATHGLIDMCTSYGTVYFWPFSNQRIAWDVISIIDPFFTIPLIAGVVWTQVFGNRRGVLVGLLTASIVLSFGVWQHQSAIGAMEHYAKAKQLPLKHVRTFPNLASSSFWRGAAMYDGKILLADIYTPLNGSPKLSNIRVFSQYKEIDLPTFVKESKLLSRDYKVFNWFSDDYVVATSQRPLVLIDVRYLWGEPPVALWGIEFTNDNDHISKLRNIRLNIESEEQ